MKNFNQLKLQSQLNNSLHMKWHEQLDPGMISFLRSFYSHVALTDLSFLRQLSLQQCKLMCHLSCGHSLRQYIQVGTLNRYLLSCSTVDVARTPLSPAWSHAWPLIWFTFTLLWTLANFRFKGLRGFATREFHFIVLVLLASNTHQYQPTKVVLKRHWVTLKRIGWHREGILCRTSRLWFISV